LDALLRLLTRRIHDRTRPSLNTARRRVNLSILQRKRLQSARQQTGGQMTLSAPSAVVFIVSAILWALAVIGHFAQILFVTENGFWVVVIAYLILAVGNLFRGV
jgi:hypothetical protein